MANVTVAVAVSEPAVAVIVTVAVEAAVGVPEITPDDESSVKPAGSAPDEYVTGPPKYDAVNAVDADNTEPTVPDNVCVDGLNEGAAALDTHATAMSQSMWCEGALLPTMTIVPLGSTATAFPKSLMLPKASSAFPSPPPKVVSSSPLLSNRKTEALNWPSLRPCPKTIFPSLWRAMPWVSSDPPAPTNAGTVIMPSELNEVSSVPSEL